MKYLPKLGHGFWFAVNVTLWALNCLATFQHNLQGEKVPSAITLFLAIYFGWRAYCDFKEGL